MDDMRLAEKALGASDVKFSARKVQVFYGDSHAIKDVNVDIEDNTVTAFIDVPFALLFLTVWFVERRWRIAAARAREDEAPPLPEEVLA